MENGIKLNLPLSRFLSCAYLCICLVSSVASVFLVVKVLEGTERAFLNPIGEVVRFSKSDLYLAWVVSTVAPLLSVAAMGTPILQVWHAMRHMDEDVHLQWRLFVSLAVCTSLGVVYGIRKGFGAVIVSSFCGLTLQTVNLAAAYRLACRKDRILPSRLIKLHVSHKPTSSFLQCAFFCPLLGIPLLCLFMVGFVVPLDSCLSPIYTICCLLPYFATFSTFPGDLRSYRLWAAGEAAGDASDEEAAKHSRGPPGVDLNTLWVMQTANVFWATFGFLFWDMAILISAVVSIVAAGSQLCCFLLPAFAVSVRPHSWKTGVPVSSPKYAVIDCGWLFVGDFSFVRILPPVSFPTSDAIEMETLLPSPHRDEKRRDLFGEAKERSSPEVFSKSHPPRMFSNEQYVEGNPKTQA